MTGNANDQGRTTASRLFAVLDAFADASGPMTLAEISRAAQLPTSTAGRLVGHLVGWGGLHRTPDGAYQVGIRLWRVGMRAALEQNLHEAAMTAMQEVHEYTGQHVQLYASGDGGVVHLAKVAGRRSIKGATPVGSRVPLHATASGKVFLAFADRSVLRMTVDAGLRRYTRRTIVDGRVLTAAVERVREAGVGHSWEERRSGVSAVAVPIVMESILVGTMAVVGPATTNLRTCERHLAAASERVADELAARRPQEGTVWMR